MNAWETNRFDVLYKRTVNASRDRDAWDKEIEYSCKNYLAIAAILEIRHILLAMSIGSTTSYKRDF